MYRYRAFGLGIHSLIELPELPEEDIVCDVLVRRGVVAGRPWRPDEGDDYVEAGPTDVAFGTAVGWFQLRNGNEIVIEQTPGSDAGLVRLVLFGRAIAALLQLRGRLVLHASAVTVRRGAVALMGPSGVGKSTLAAAFARAGSSFLTDEILPIDVAHDPPLAYPGFPKHRLTADAAGLLGFDSSEGTACGQGQAKKHFPGAHAAMPDPVPLHALILLTLGAPAGLEILSPGAALPLLLGNSYAPRLIGVTESHAMHLTACSRLLVHATVGRLTIDRSLQSPHEVVAVVERELTREESR